MDAYSVYCDISVRTCTHAVPVVQTAVSEVGTLAMVGPSKPVIAGIIELLIRIVGGARPNLELSPIGVLAIHDVKTLISEKCHRAAGESPLLREGTRAVLQSDSGTVSVGSGGHAFSLKGLTLISAPPQKKNSRSARQNSIRAQSREHLCMQGLEPGPEQRGLRAQR